MTPLEERIKEFQHTKRMAGEDDYGTDYFCKLLLAEIRHLRDRGCPETQYYKMPYPNSYKEDLAFKSGWQSAFDVMAKMLGEK